jgi:hypothetical protein
MNDLARPRPLHRLLASAATVFTLAFSPSPATGQLVYDLVRQASSADSAGRFADAARLWYRVYRVNGGEPSPLYGAAQSAARAGDKRAAFSDLHRALDEGLAIPVTALQADSEWTSLRDDRRWSELVALAKHHASQRDTVLRAELLSLGQRDQQNRESIDSVVRRYGKGSPEAQSAERKLAEGDARLQSRLRAIVNQFGWPGRRLVGDDAAHAAWLLLQHSDTSYQRVMLPMIRERARQNDVRAADAALLEDRVRVGKGRKQRFGSQLRNTSIPGAPPVLYPIEAEECVDVRRAAVLLPPLADYLALFGVKYSPPRKECRATPS